MLDWLLKVFLESGFIDPTAGLPAPSSLAEAALRGLPKVMAERDVRSLSCAALTQIIAVVPSPSCPHGGSIRATARREGVS